MCGIFAISGPRRTAGNDVLEGLKNWSIEDTIRGGSRFETGREFPLKRSRKDLRSKKEFPSAQEGFGHSRWATHGGVTKENAHPHKAGRVTLAHNGIFENYLEYRKKFSSYAFKSETDSEVIAVLIDSFLPTGHCE
ncbi:hypothetical protein HC823_02335 [Candidatus Gracilibacteria bacterium]|nr:hypothetical protein [Candidatus Gracilibacteria bacterium]